MAHVLLLSYNFNLIEERLKNLLLTFPEYFCLQIQAKLTKLALLMIWNHIIVIILVVITTTTIIIIV